MKQRNTQILKRASFYVISSMLFLKFNLFAMDEPKEDGRSKNNGTKVRLERRKSSSSMSSHIFHGTPKKNGDRNEDKERMQRSRSYSLSSHIASLALEKRADENGDIEMLQRSSSSSLSPLSEEMQESDSSLESPIKTGNEQETSYMECVVHLFKNKKSSSEVAKILIYSYPIFTDEKYFFGQLINFKKKYSKYIISFLNQLSFEAFPNGIKNLCLAETEFNELQKGLVNYPILNMSILNNFTHNYSNDQNIKNINKNNFNPLIDDNSINAKNLNIGDFSNALLARDLEQFRQRLPSDLKKPESLETLSRHYNQTSNWVGLQIITAPNSNEREKLFKTFCCIGDFLIKTGNFHGAMQIAAGLNNKSVERLMEINNEDKKTFQRSEGDSLIKRGPLNTNNEEIIEKEKDRNWINLSAFSNPNCNYKIYRSYLPKDHTESSSYLPAIPVITGDLLHAYDSYKSAKELQIKVFALQAIAKIVENFFKFRTLNYPETKPGYMKLVNSFDIHEETLDVFSDLIKPWNALQYNNIPEPQSLKDWTPLYFASILRKTGCTSQIPEIFRRGICTGENILKLMGTGDIEEKREQLNQLGINEMMIKAILSPHSEQLNPNQISPKIDTPLQ